MMEVMMAKYLKLLSMICLQVVVFPHYMAAFAADVADPISGGAGWVGAGLLGGVLAWLLFWHLPAKDKQINDFVVEKDAHIERMTATANDRLDRQRTEFTATLTVLANNFKQESQAERESCEKHFTTLSNTMSQAFVTLGNQLESMVRANESHSERNQQWLEVMKAKVEKLVEEKEKV